MKHVMQSLKRVRGYRLVNCQIVIY